MRSPPALLAALRPGRVVGTRPGTGKRTEGRITLIVRPEPKPKRR